MQRKSSKRRIRGGLVLAATVLFYTSDLLKLDSEHAFCRAFPGSKLMRSRLPMAATHQVDEQHWESLPSFGRRSSLAGLTTGLIGSSSAHAAEDPKITQKCELLINIGTSKKKQRIVIGLFGEDAPISTRSFARACEGSVPGPAGAQARYTQASIAAVSKDRRLTFAEFPGGNFLLERQETTKAAMASDLQKENSRVEVRKPLAGPDTETTESNSLKNNVLGRVSMRKGGGSYNFNIAPVADAPWLDRDNLVVGQVIEGLDVVAEINDLQVFQKGGWVNAIPGDKFGDKDVWADLSRKPTQKVRIVKSTLL